MHMHKCYAPRVADEGYVRRRFTENSIFARQLACHVLRTISAKTMKTTCSDKIMKSINRNIVWQARNRSQ